MKKIALIIIFLGIITSVIAQIDTTEIDKMDKLDLIEGKESEEVKVISASRSNRKISELPTTIQVITKEEIQRNGYITLVDVLKHIPGIRTSQPGSGELGESFLMRGLIGNYYTKILLNSIPLQPSATGTLPIAEQLPIAQAERIEIVFGPASAIYGADAMAGVINIITKTSDNNTFVDANITTGEYGYRHTNITLGGKFGKDKNVVRYTVYANHTKRDDLNTFYDKELYMPINNITFTDQQRQAALANPNGFLQNFILNPNVFPYYKGTIFTPEFGTRPQNSHLLGVQVQYRNFQFSFNEMYRQNHWSTGLSPLIFSYANPNNYIGDKLQRYTISYNKEWKKFSLTTNLSYNRYRTNPKSSRGSNYAGFNGNSYRYTASDDIFGELLLRFTSSKNWEWTFGTSFQISSILPFTNDLAQPFDEKNYSPFQRKIPDALPILGTFGFNPQLYSNVGFFAQFIKTLDKWTLVGGFRVDRNSGYENGTALSVAPAGVPIGQIRVSAQYNVKKNLSVRLSLGSAFKAPSPSETYVSLGIPIAASSQVLYQQIPNTALRPEAMFSSELGIRYNVNNNFSFESILYTYTISQRISSVSKLIDLTTYPNAVPTAPNQPITGRSYGNDDLSNSVLTSLQILAKYKNLIPVWKFNIDADINYSQGQEVLPDDPLRSDDGGTINEFRMVPRWSGRLNFDFSPAKNWYFRFENVIMSSWQRRYALNAALIDDTYKVNGYHSLDIIARYKVSKNINTYCRVTNVFNQNYGGIDATGLDVDLRYNPQYLRMFQMGINFNLD
ncbi:MAG: TonB-dependent receptor [Cytophagales bacterium]|nr:MAG: TonB-dependent receptor [Cytophagales bacterium]